MPTVHAPDGTTFHDGPFDLVNDGEVYNYESLQKDAGTAKGLIAKALDNAATAYRRVIAGVVSTDGASGVTIEGGAGFTVSIEVFGSNNGIRVDFDTPFASKNDYALHCQFDFHVNQGQSCTFLKEEDGFFVKLMVETADVGGDNNTQFEQIDVDAVATSLDFIVAAVSL